MANWWDDPDLMDTTPTPKEPSMWDKLKANITHNLAVAGEGALHAVPDNIGFLGDIGHNLVQMARDPMHGSTLIDVAKAPPGTGVVSKKVGQSFDRAEQAYIKQAGGSMADVTPRNKPEEYLNTISRGVADTLVTGPEVKALASGATGATAAKATYDATGDENLAAAAALAGGMAPEALHVVVPKVRLGMAIRDGMQHPDWRAVNDVIVGDLEGGGTLSNPAVSKKGAVGPQQVMPDTARDPGFGIKPWDGKSQTDLARVGRQYSAAMMSKYGGDVEKVFAAYNAGPGRVDKLVAKYGDNWADHLPTETKNYVSKGIRKLGGDNVTSFEEARNARDFKPLPEDYGGEDIITPRLPDASRDYLRERNPDRLDQIDAMSDDEVVKHAHYQGMKVTDVLTPAERQEMDASVPTQPVDNTSYEKHTPYIDEPNTPANDAVGPSLKIIQETDPDRINMARLMGDVNKADHELPEFHDADVYNLEINHEGKRSTGTVTINKEGKATLDINPPEDEKGGYAYNEKLNLGPAETRSLLRQLTHQFPEITSISGDRITGARKGKVDTGVPVEIKLGRDKAGGQPLNKASIEEPQKRGIIQTFVDMMKDDSGAIGKKPPEDANYEGLAPEEKLIKAIDEAKPISGQQKRAYGEERAARAAKLAEMQAKGGGMEGYKAEMAHLKGQLPKVEFESIAKHFTPEDMDTLLNRIKGNQWLLPFEKATAQTSLLKLLGAEGAKVPSQAELKLLTHVFPEEMVDALMRNRPFAARFWNGVSNAINIPRSLMASFDLSGALRQGVFMVGRKEFYPAFAKMFQLFGSEKASKALMQEIRERPTYPLMRRAGLAITNPEGKFLDTREEAFMSSWAEKIPVVGRVVKASDQAYSGFLNKLRADTFDSLVKLSKESGIDLEKDGKTLKDMARYINSATGRGDVGGLIQKNAHLLNAMFFSPRLIASRMTMLNPAFYVQLSPVVRKEAIKSLIGFSAIALTVLNLAKHAGLDVETDSRSADFAKIKVGDTRYDVLGGFQQYIRFGAEMLTGESKTASGKINSLTKNQYGKDTRLDVVEKFFENKFSPVASFIADYLRGKDPAGNKFKWTKEIASRFIPLVAQDTADAFKEYGAKGLLSGIPGIFGVGVQTYKPKKAKAKAPKKEWWDQ